MNSVQAHPHGYRLTFNQHEQVTARYVILALPTPALRKIDLCLDLSDDLRRFIHEIDMGRNEKFIMGCHQRVWRQKGAFATECWNDGSVSLVWDSSVRELSSSACGALTFFLMSGREGLCADADIQAQGQALAAEYDTAIPGLQAVSNGRYIRSTWHSTEGIMGGYTNFRPGQYTGFASRCMYVESSDPGACQTMQAGRLLFAGEHTSDEYYGFMNGAAQSGRLAADWVVRDLCSGAEPVDHTWAHVLPPAAQQSRE